MSLELAIVVAAINGDSLSPQITTSSKYKYWVSVEDVKRCFECANNHGKIWQIVEQPYPEPPMHPNCRCAIELMQAITAGTATINGTNGADWMLLFKRSLPDYYVSQKELESLGWHKGNKVSKFTAEKMLFGGTYKNINQHLPHIEGARMV